jgi:uncharacterized protein with HEPN domain
VERHTSAGREAFENDELVQTWVVHHMQVIGEAAGALTPELTREHPEVAWRDITGTRHVLVHDYFAVNMDKVWSIVEDNLPVLKSQITEILGKLAG